MYWANSAGTYQGIGLHDNGSRLFCVLVGTPMNWDCVGSILDLLLFEFKALIHGLPESFVVRLMRTYI